MQLLLTKLNVMMMMMRFQKGLNSRKQIPAPSQPTLEKKSANLDAEIGLFGRPSQAQQPAHSFQPVLVYLCYKWSSCPTTA